ncbi:MAG: peptide chain release factor-like protein [Verrucomicrobiota bacterium]
MATAKACQAGHLRLVLAMDSEARLRALGIEEDQLEERFIKGSGAGGQKINKTSSCVQLRHLPSGWEIKCQSSRSLSANREEARQLLCDHLEAQARAARQNRLARRSKIRAQKRRPSASQKKKNIEQKRRHGDKKRLRGKLDW